MTDKQLHLFWVDREIPKDLAGRSIKPGPSDVIGQWIDELKAEPEYKAKNFNLLATEVVERGDELSSPGTWIFSILIVCSLAVAERILDLDYEIAPHKNSNVVWRPHQESEPVIVPVRALGNVFSPTPFQTKLIAKHHLYSLKSYKLKRLFKTADEWMADWASFRHYTTPEDADVRYCAIVETLLALGRTY